VIRGEIGIILEFPGSLLAVLGEMHAFVPSEALPVAKINMSVSRMLDIGRKTFALDAALHDSVIQGFPISGQMAMRIGWGDNPEFALAVGGFHPAFKPPPGFPKLAPLSVALSRGSNPSITLTGFFALTSNTLQVGGLAMLKASGAGIQLTASVSVQAIMVFSPFAFDAQIRASVRVTFHGVGIGVTLTGRLTGPSPFRIQGEVCASLWVWKACHSFDKTFGSGKPAEVPAIDVWEGDDKRKIVGVRGALADARNWRALPPPAGKTVVSIAESDTPGLDPFGMLSVRQRVAPLERTQPLTRFGSGKATKPTKLVFASATVGTKTLKKVDVLQDSFAPGQFFDLDDKKRLSAPAFERSVSGYVFAADEVQYTVGSARAKTITYKTVVIDERVPKPAEDYTLPGGQLEGLTNRSSAGTGGLSESDVDKFADREGLVPENNEALYVVADTEEMKVFPEFAADFTDAIPLIEAMFWFEGRLAEHPEDEGNIQIVPESQARAA
jgi:hypothetical protein